MRQLLCHSGQLATALTVVILTVAKVKRHTVYHDEPNLDNNDNGAGVMEQKHCIQDERSRPQGAFR